MFSIKSLALFAAIAATGWAQEDPKPNPGESDCRIAKQGGMYFHQVVVNHDADRKDTCVAFTKNIHQECGQNTIQITCPDDDDPKIITFWYETDTSCGAAQVETAISKTTGEESPSCIEG